MYTNKGTSHSEFGVGPGSQGCGIHVSMRRDGPAVIGTDVGPNLNHLPLSLSLSPVPPEGPAELGHEAAIRHKTARSKTETWSAAGLHY